MSTTVDPRFLDVVRWTAQSAVILAPYCTPPVLRDPARWPDWAAYVCNTPAIAAFGIPRPERFSDWRAWAFAFNSAAKFLSG